MMKYKVYENNIVLFDSLYIIKLIIILKLLLLSV